MYLLNIDVCTYIKVWMCVWKLSFIMLNRYNFLRLLTLPYTKCKAALPIFFSIQITIILYIIAKCSIYPSSHLNYHEATLHHIQSRYVCSSTIFSPTDSDVWAGASRRGQNGLLLRSAEIFRMLPIFRWAALLARNMATG